MTTASDKESPVAGGAGAGFSAPPIKAREALIGQLFGEMDELFQKFEKLLAASKSHEEAMAAASKSIDASTSRFVEGCEQYVALSKNELAKAAMSAGQDAKALVSNAVAEAVAEITATMKKAASEAQQSREARASADKLRDTIRTIAIAVLASGVTAGAMLLASKMCS